MGHQGDLTLVVGSFYFIHLDIGRVSELQDEVLMLLRNCFMQRTWGNRGIHDTSGLFSSYNKAVNWNLVKYCTYLCNEEIKWKYEREYTPKLYKIKIEREGEGW